MLIRIIQTTYGYRPILPDGKRSHYVIPVRRGDAPIEVEQAEAERLLSLGVAEEVTEKTKTVQKPVETIPAPVDEPEEMNLEAMSFNDLKAHAQSLGIETGKLRSKAALIEAINNAETEEIPFSDLPDLTVEDLID